MASKSDMVVKLVLVFFISLLSFSIGIFAGKKYSDNQHMLSQLEPQKAEKSSREVASVHDEEGAEKKTGTMTDDEIAKLAEEFVADEKAPTEGETVAKEEGHGGHGEAATQTAKTEAAPAKETAHGKTAAKATTTAHTEEPSAVAKDLAAGKAPAHTAPAAKPAPAAETRVPSSLPKDVAQYTVGKFTVQVAAYADEGEAQKFASDLKTKGYSAFYVPATVKGKTWYRVSVGQFATPKEAASYRTELLSKAKVSSAIVQKITE